MIFLANIDLSQNELQNCILQPLATPPATPKLGQIYTNSATSKIMWFNGTAWQTVGVVVEKSAVNGNIKVDGVEMSVYELPVATTTTVGGIKVGAGLSITSDGTLSATGGGVADSVAWENVTGRPTKLSQFTNDEGFIGNTVNNLLNYYLKSETYNKTEVNDLVSNIVTLNILKVDQLPTENISTTTIYLVPKTSMQENNICDEYIYINDKWEIIGNTEIDLTNYLQTTGNASNVTVNFTEASELNVPVTGESLSIIMGKILHYLNSLSVVAITGDYQSLSNKPKTVAINEYQLSTASGEYLAVGKVLNVMVKDSVTNEPVLVDYIINKDTSGTREFVNITLSQVPTNPLTVIISEIQ